jgi:hypothetical protein
MGMNPECGRLRMDAVPFPGNAITDTECWWDFADKSNLDIAESHSSKLHSFVIGEFMDYSITINAKEGIHPCPIDADFYRPCPVCLGSGG